MKGECRVCGCTDNEPCIDGATGYTCCWVNREQNLCDFCADLEGEALAAFQRGYRERSEDEPLIVPATEYQAQRYIDELRRGRQS